jgi:hypothetical protein
MTRFRKYRPQNLMPSRDLTEASREDIDVQRSDEMEGDGNVIHCGTGSDLLVEPNLLLEDRQFRRLIVPDGLGPGFA